MFGDYSIGDLGSIFVMQGFAGLILFSVYVLMALGLSQVTPSNVAIPFKLLLFVVMDGWSTLIHGLVLTYR